MDYNHKSVEDYSQYITAPANVNLRRTLFSVHLKK